MADKWAPPPAEYRIEQIDVVLQDQMQPPAHTAPWQARMLPLSIRSVGRENSIWYRIDLSDVKFQLPGNDTTNGSAAPWVLSVGAPFGAVALYRNNELIGEAGARSAPLSVHRAPVSFNLSPALLHAEDVLYVHFQRPNSTGWVYFNYLAPRGKLQPYLNYQQFMRVHLVRLIQVVMGTIALIVLLLYLMRPRDAEYGWWALMLLSWGLREASEASVDPWLQNQQYWILLGDLSLGVFAVSGYQFIKRYVGFRNTPFDLGIATSGLIWGALLISFAYTGVLTRELSTLFWTPWVVIVALVCCATLLFATVRPVPVEPDRGPQPPRDTGWLLAVCWFITITGVWDYKSPIDPFAIAGYIQYLAYSAGIALLVFTVILMRRFAGALGSAEQANTVLEQRLVERTNELEHSYAKANAATNAKLVHEERERIMRDMHDGIGGQLVQALSMVSQDDSLAPLEPTLREALDDLRLIIDSLSVPDGNLPVLLATLRHRLSQPIQRAGLEFDWRLEDLPNSTHLSQSDLLHVLRILQESVTNILKHAEASRLAITTDVDSDGRIRIRIADDGVGLKQEDQRQPGRGLPSLYKRSSAVGADLSIEAGPDKTGTQVKLVLPAAPPMPEPPLSQHG